MEPEGSMSHLNKRKSIIVRNQLTLRLMKSEGWKAHLNKRKDIIVRN